MQINQKYRTLLIVDDEEFILDLLKRQLKDTGFNILAASSGDAALELVKAHQIGVIVSDQMMPGMDGITFLNKVRDIDKEAVLIILTANREHETVIAAVNQLQIFSYIVKPWSAPIMQATIENAFTHHETRSTYEKTLKRMAHQSEQLNKEIVGLTDCNAELEMELKKFQAVKS